MLSQIVALYETSLPATLADLHEFQRWIAEQFHDLPYTVEFVDRNPYRNFAQMQSEVKSSRVLSISALNNHSMFDPHINLQFRAVHDADHLRHGFRFDLFGEQQACRVFVERCRDEQGRNALFCEILGQACVALSKGIFARQKLVHFPLKLRERALREDLHTASPLALPSIQKSKIPSVTPPELRRAA